MIIRVKIFSGFWTLLIVIISCNGQGRRCNPGNQCISLLSCDSILSLRRTNKSAFTIKVRNKMCGFDGRTPLVCCRSIVEVTTEKLTTFQIGIQGSGERLLTPNCGISSTVDRIINGAPAPIGAYPWMAAMGYKQPGVNHLQFLCSGSLINSRYVLTAAHCLDPTELGRRRLMVIHLGDWNLSTDVDCQRSRISEKCLPPHVVVGFEDTVSHPMYNKRGRTSDDIALIRLNQNLDIDNLPNIWPICLPPKNFDLKTFAGNRKPVAAGWGLTEHGNNSNILLRVDVPFSNDKLCKELYSERYVGNQLCVGGSEEGFDTCSGDSGGPLILSGSMGPPFFQIGIVSFGPFPCGLRDFPGVYTNVADYRDWILKNIKP